MKKYINKKMELVQTSAYSKQNQQPTNHTDSKAKNHQIR